MTPGLRVLVLAGNRPGGDPLAASRGVEAKALIPVAGEAMLSRVVRTLADHPSIGDVIVAAQQVEPLRTAPGCAWMQDRRDISWHRSQGSIADTIDAMVADGANATGLLVTSADNVLLDAAMIDDFVAGAARSDLAVAMVSRRTLLARYPESRRTWLKFRRDWWSGANLFWLGGSRVAPLVELWRSVEQDRKKGWRIIAAFGPGLLIAAALRLITLETAIARVGRRFGVDARLVAMPQAEACIDVDKHEDLALAESIILGRSSASSATQAPPSADRR